MCTQVLNLLELLKPIKERALEAAVREARQDALSNAVATIAAQITAQQSQGRLGQCNHVQKEEVAYTCTHSCNMYMFI